MGVELTLRDERPASSLGRLPLRCCGLPFFETEVTDLSGSLAKACAHRANRPLGARAVAPTYREQDAQLVLEQESVGYGALTRARSGNKTP
jgi:hypothetical protein